MPYKQFTDLIMRQEAMKLYVAIAQHIASLGFKEYSFKDQLLRATLSISNNIAEGYERGSTKELIRFLYIAKSSCAEVHSMLMIAEQMSYFDPTLTKKWIGESAKIATLIGRYIQSTTNNLPS